MRRLTLASILAVLVSLLVVASAQAFVVNDGGTVAGAALAPGTRANPLPAGVSRVTSGGLCSDPWLTSDLRLGSNGLCWHSGGSVLHKNETFALTWDRPTPNRSYWETTRQYEQQFLRDVADGSGAFTSPYAITPQYNDPRGRAENSSTYGGGCIDLGAAGGFTCQFGSTTGSGTGNDYPPAACPTTGTEPLHLFNDGSVGPNPNASGGTCLTDAQIKSEVSAASGQLNGHTKPGYSPVVVVLTPPGVVDCLDSGGQFCSANSSAPARFCSYHSQVNGLPYVVVPWTPLTTCDEPKAPVIDLANPPPMDKLAQYVGHRLVSSLSQAHIAAIVNPLLNGWFALDGSEINDSGWQDGDPNFGCRPLPDELDRVIVGSSSQNPYHLQREYNNAAAIESDPNAPGCALSNIFGPAFVSPSAVRPGDVVEFDGSDTASTLVVPKGNYHWDFGDGVTAVGPSVVHTYSRGGDYNVTLTVTDRGGNTRSLSQTISVLGKNGQPVSPGSGTRGGWRARVQLVPQGLRKLLSSGVAMRVHSNRRADGIATLMIPRAAARRAHIRSGKKSFVVIGRGTVSGIRNGARVLHIKIPRQTARNLRRLHRLNLTIRLALVSAGREHLTLVVAGRY